MPPAQMVLHALLYFGSFTAVIILFLDVIAATWWLLKRGLWLAGRFVRAITEE
jgi:hypothetical protein